MEMKPEVAQVLKDKVAIVTGAGGDPSIGRSVAIRLAEEGAKTAIFDIDVAGAEAVAAEITAAGGQALACGCDVTDFPGIEAAVKRVTDTWGRRVDILVNSAAWYKGMGGFRDFDEWPEASVGQDDGGERQGPVEHGQSRGAHHERAPVRQDRQRGVRLLPHRGAGLHPLHLQQGRGRRVHARAGQRAGRFGHQGEHPGARVTP